MTNQKLQHILNLNPQSILATRGFFANYPVEQFYIKNNSALILGTSDHLWAHLVGTSEADIAFLLSKHHAKTPYYYSVEKWMIPLIRKHGEIDWKMSTERYILNDKLLKNAPRSEVIPIDESYAAYIYQHSDYKDFTSTEYIEDRLARDISAGIIVDNKLIAWGFTHDDGALGFLHVLPEHRKKGYGMDIVQSLIRMRQDENKSVFCNIVPENTASIYLVNKLNFVFDRLVYWVKMKEGDE